MGIILGLRCQVLVRRVIRKEHRLIQRVVAWQLVRLRDVWVVMRVLVDMAIDQRIAEWDSVLSVHKSLPQADIIIYCRILVQILMRLRSLQLCTIALLVFQIERTLDVHVPWETEIDNSSISDFFGCYLLALLLRHLKIAIMILILRRRDN